MTNGSSPESLDISLKNLEENPFYIVSSITSPMEVALVISRS